MDFKPIQKLNVSRTLTTGDVVNVGVLAQNSQGVFFQYDAEYVAQFGNLSPFSLKRSSLLQTAPRQPHAGLHGVFADSLPDGWGLFLQDRIFRQHGILPAQITAMDRLAFVGSRGMGALSYSPVSDYQIATQDEINLDHLGLEAQALFDGQTEDVLSALVTAGSSGGARPKAQLFFSPDHPERCRTTPQRGDEAWLVKFTSQNLALGHEEGLCEATYLHLAQQANLAPPEWKLLSAPAKSGAKAWLAVKRFDWIDHVDPIAHPHGRLHMHSACGLLDADYRMPSLDYADLIKASSQLCQSATVPQLQFRRAMFNLFACNQDDHSKNWAFLQLDNAQWQAAPFYDVTFSPHPFNQHATAFVGYGKKPSLQAIQKLADHAGFASWQQAQHQIHEIVDVIAGFAQIAQQNGLDRRSISMIEKTLARCLKDNHALI